MKSLSNILTHSQIPSWSPSSFNSTFEIILESLSFLSMNSALIRSLTWTIPTASSGVTPSASLYSKPHFLRPCSFPPSKMTSFHSAVLNLPTSPHNCVILSSATTAPHSIPPTFLLSLNCPNTSKPPLTCITSIC